MNTSVVRVTSLRQQSGRSTVLHSFMEQVCMVFLGQIFKWCCVNQRRFMKLHDHEFVHSISITAAYSGLCMVLYASKISNFSSKAKIPRFYVSRPDYCSELQPINLTHRGTMLLACRQVPHTYTTFPKLRFSGVSVPVGKWFQNLLLPHIPKFVDAQLFI